MEDLIAIGTSSMKRVISINTNNSSIILKYVLGTLYKLITLVCPINQKKVVFASFRSNQLSGNLEYIYKELKNTNNDFSMVFLFGKYKKKPLGQLRYYVQMIRAILHLATSRYFFIDDYYLPVYLVAPRKGTEIIQLWHAAGAFKKFGHSTVGKPFGPSVEYIKHINIHSNYSKVFVSTDEVIPFYQEAFDMSPKDIYPMGLPRTDYFFETRNHFKVKEKFFNEFPELKTKKLVLYAPTFRGKGSMDHSLDFNVMKRILGDDYALLVHLHPYMNEDIDNSQGFVYHINNKYSIEEILILSDMLITDYSSIIFDYSILSRPIAFYANDLESYTKERDFYYQYEDIVPGPVFDSSVEIAEWIKKGEFDLDSISQFRKRFLPNCDGNVSKRIVKQILSSN
ncbi:CDP-glycerol glycerophosphotransferase family protein [Neobacillus niacini]|uniref:CDP-glycerol glycerophosphotransferase family protein n=1 Tax=Neobacillus niacini TaxID=86668 RepID=UPI003983994D